MRTISRLGFALAALCLSACCQSDYHSFGLRVVDSDGNPVVGATITATNLGRGNVETIVTEANGYGFVGVCNDSNAVVELATKGTVSTFPLMRARALDAAPDLGDGLDQTIKALPNDGDGIVDAKDALRRAVAMQPFEDGSPLMWDAVLGAQIATARRDLAR